MRLNNIPTKFNSEIILVTGSFDLLHEGHKYLLAKAKEVSKTAKLLVIVMDDINIRRRKGPGRPIQKLEVRISALDELEVIDYLYAWKQPWENLALFILQLQPDYYIAMQGDPGIDKKRDTIQSYGGKFIIFERLPGFSTSEKIAKIN